jgi:hypothetical protein
MLLSACGPGTIRSQNYVVNPMLPDHFIAASRQVVPLVVKGNPFRDPNGDFVAQAMSAASCHPRKTYVSAPQGGLGYYVVMGFGGRPVGGSNYCNAPDLVPGRAYDNGSSAHAAFCLGSSLLSEATAWTGRIETDADPRIPALFRELQRQLFPWSDPLYLSRYPLYGC